MRLAIDAVSKGLPVAFTCVDWKSDPGCKMICMAGLSRALYGAHDRHDLSLWLIEDPSPHAAVPLDTKLATEDSSNEPQVSYGTQWIQTERIGYILSLNLDNP